MAEQAMIERIRELERVLIEARDVLALGAEMPPPDHRNSEAVTQLGDRIGYGALMATASLEWRGRLGDLAGGEFALVRAVQPRNRRLN